MPKRPEGVEPACWEWLKGRTPQELDAVQVLLGWMNRKPALSTIDEESRSSYRFTGTDYWFWVLYEAAEMRLRAAVAVKRMKVGHA